LYEEESLITLCRESFWYFATHYCKTNDEYGNVELLPDYDYLFKLKKRWDQPKTPVVDVKSAQNLITWLAAAVHVYEILFGSNIMNGYMSIGQFESSKVKRRCQHIIDNLPDWFLSTLKTEQIRKSEKEIEFKHAEGNSIIVFLHSSDKSGRSFTFHRATLDEAAFMQNFKYIYKAMKNRSVYLNCYSTPPEHRSGYFYKLWSQALELGIDASEIHYRDNPEKLPGTEQGEKWREEESRGVTKETWDREQECKFLSSGGMVYSSFDRDAHIVDPLILDPSWDYFRGIDFGWTHPFVHLWVARWSCGSWHRWYVFREHYKSKLKLSVHAKSIMDFDKRPRVFKHDDQPEHDEKWLLKNKYLDEISDASGAQERAELIGLGIRTRPSRKGKDSVNTKINKVREALMIKPDGKPGLLVSKECVKTIFEFENYMYPEETEDGEHEKAPIKKWDHAMDVIGDIIHSVNNYSESGNQVFDW